VQRRAATADDANAPLYTALASRLHPAAPVLVVQKYGGSSVGTLERIRACADRCLRTQAAGHDLVVVVSAMAGETNRLIALANALVDPAAESASRGPWVAATRRSESHDRELDQLVSTGETVSAALLAMAIHARGGQAVSLTGVQLGMRTDDAFTRARIAHIDRERIQQELARGRIVVCTGFQGVNQVGDVTTLGRGGSDTSAVAVAAAMRADVCEILTDVDGVFTTDPRLVPDARKIDRISHEEMLELSSVGAKVLQIRSVEFATRYGVPVHVRSSANEDEGTWVVPEEKSMESVVVSAVALDENEAKVTVLDAPDVPGTVARIFGELADAGIVVDMIIQNVSHDGRTDVTFTVPEADLPQAQARLEGLRIGGAELRLVTDREICKVSIVGLGMRTHAGVAARMFELLAAEGINIAMVSTSTIKISVVVHQSQGQRALACLHAGFGLSRGPADAASLARS
jgi:aspartate kinase